MTIKSTAQYRWSYLMLGLPEGHFSSTFSPIHGSRLILFLNPTPLELEKRCPIYNGGFLNDNTLHTWRKQNPRSFCFQKQELTSSSGYIFEVFQAGCKAGWPKLQLHLLRLRIDILPRFVTAAALGQQPPQQAFCTCPTVSWEKRKGLWAPTEVKK